MITTFQELQRFLPTELTDVLNELNRRVHAKSKQAWEFLKDNPEVEGLPASNYLDWLEASICVTFLQFVEDGKIEAVGEHTQEIRRLLDAANNVVCAFGKKYQDPTSIMRPQNFVKNYIAIARVKFSTLDPFTLCVPTGYDPIGSEDEIDAALSTPDWQSVREIDPEYHDLIRKAVAKAAYWSTVDRPDSTIIPIEVARDFILLNSLADKVNSLQKDIKALLESNGSKKALNTLESILDESFHDFASRLSMYETTIIHTDMHLAARQLAKDFSGSPQEIIERFGPECLCVPWLVEQQNELMSNRTLK